MSTVQSSQEQRPTMEQQEKKPSCAITSQGITLMGYEVSWLIIVAVLLLLYLLMKGKSSDNMFGESVGVSSTVAPTLPASSIPRVGAPGPLSGEVARIFGHNRW